VSLFKGVVPLRVVECFPKHCIAETSCRLITVKIFYDTDQLVYQLGQEVGQVSLRTCIPEIRRKYRQEGDYAPDKLTLEPEKPNKWLEAP
jgi:hypothetical protein